MSRSKRAFVFAVACALVVVSAGCMSRLGDGPDTVGGAIRAMQQAAAAHDWKAYAAYWDLEAAGVLYEQDSRGLADRIWMDELKEHGVPEKSWVPCRPIHAKIIEGRPVLNLHVMGSLQTHPC